MSASRSWLDLNVRGRAVLAAAYLVVQVALLATVPARPDKTFAFQMFNESSAMEIALYRRVTGAGQTNVPMTSDGRWQARDRSGTPRWFAWSDRVRDPILGTLGRPVQAAYGVDAQLFRLQAALDDVTAHLEEDTETQALVAEVSLWKNGRGVSHQHLESARPPDGDAHR